MKIFAIRDATDSSLKNLAYLLYYESSKQFYIELPDNADPWETPLLLDAFVQKGEHTVNSYWSRIWVQQRIVPSDRQNIGQILRDNKVKTYDEYALLTLSSGRCEQDDYYLVPIDEAHLPQQLARRLSRKIADIVPLQTYSLLTFFRDGTIRKCDLKERLAKDSRYAILLNRPDYFARVEVQTGGHGVQWDRNLSISDSELYTMGERVPLSVDDFHTFASKRIINTAEATDILNCSRQYISELVRTGKLHPVKVLEKNMLFLKSEVLRRNWQ